MLIALSSLLPNKASLPHGHASEMEVPMHADSQTGMTLSPAVKESIDSLLNDQVMADHIGGAILQVGLRGRIIYTKIFGYAEKFHLVNGCMVRLDHPDFMTVNDLFDLASLTKFFATTFGIMILVDEGKIHLEDPVHLYLKDFMGGGKSKITIRELLNYTSGLNGWRPLYYHARNETGKYHCICKLPLKYKVREGRHYSDLGFMLLAYLIEYVSGEPLDVFLSRVLYGPLGLKETVFNPLKHGF
jgi:CubicO group peptidase (beta-lactamase class C family)